MTQRPWTTNEVKILREFAELGVEGLAQLLDRSRSSVEAKAKSSNVVLSKNGNDVAISREVDAILRRLNLSIRLPVCPVCGYRVAIIEKAGTCRVCYLDNLIQLRQEKIQELARELKLQSLRQKKRRLRICDRCGDAYFPRANAKVNQCGRCEGYE